MTLEELAREVALLRAENAALKERIRYLEERLGLNSDNSSKPPSMNPPNRKLSSLKERGKQKRGGQNGHPGHFRVLLPLEEVNEVKMYRPPDTCSCGGYVAVSSESPHRHQVFELPQVKPLVTEYQLQWGKCCTCGKNWQGTLPREVPTGILGPGFLALAALLSGAYSLSKAKISTLFSDLFGLNIAPSTLSQSEIFTSYALEFPVEEALEHLRTEAVVHLDETGFRQNNGDGQNPTGKKAWVWVARSASLSVFQVALGRGQQQAKNLVGSTFNGIAVTDRWGGYNWLEQRQLCWAHLIREFQRIGEREQTKALGEGLLNAAHELFHLWHRVRDGTLKRTVFVTQAWTIRQKIQTLLQDGAAYPTKQKDNSENARTARTCQSLLKVEASLWTFVEIPGVEPTNNSAEQALRSVVLWRKNNYGTHSERGSRFFERVMTAVASCRQQGRNVLDYLTSSLTAFFQAITAPPLLPLSP